MKVSNKLYFDLYSVLGIAVMSLTIMAINYFSGEAFRLTDTQFICVLVWSLFCALVNTLERMFDQYSVKKYSDETHPPTL